METQVLKVTALLYLNEALTNQEYEQCAQLVANAKEFGATPADIEDTIAVSLLGKKLGGQIGQAQVNNRLASLKEIN